MAIGWLSVLKIVPWTEVISNAPKVADGARKLWGAIAGKTSPLEEADPFSQPAVASEPQTIATLEARVIQLEKAVSGLHRQLLASSELIKVLADQNTQLIRRIETNRVRVLWLGVVIAAVAVVALLALLRAYWWHGA